MVLLSNPHGDWNFVNGRKWDLFRLVTNLVILLEFLEALLDGALGVVKRGLNR